MGHQHDLTCYYFSSPWSSHLVQVWPLIAGQILVEISSQAKVRVRAHFSLLDPLLSAKPYRVVKDKIHLWNKRVNLSRVSKLPVGYLTPHRARSWKIYQQGCMDLIQTQWDRDLTISFSGFSNNTWRICQQACISAKSSEFLLSQHPRLLIWEHMTKQGWVTEEWL